MKGFLLLLFIWTGVAWSQTDHPLMRRLVVFPISAPTQISQSAEETWWEIRKTLTGNKRFLVASKNFLQQKDVFQARGELKPADAIILSQLLDADAVITTFLKDKTLKMKIYEGEYGRTLWQQELVLQSSVPVSQQIKDAGVRLVKDFISSIPYHGFVAKDGLKPSVVYAEEGRRYFRVELGSDAEVQVGDQIQLIRIVGTSLKPIFVSGGQVEIFAEGLVETVDRQSVIVELKRVSSIDDIKQNSLVRVPKELARLKEKFALQESLRKNINPEYFSPEITPLDQQIQENKPLITSLSFLGNLVLFILLAI